MFICWCDCDAIKANALAVVIDVVGADDGGEFVIHRMADLLAYRALSDVVSDEALRDLVAETTRLMEMVEAGDGSGLESMLREAKALRRTRYPD